MPYFNRAALIALGLAAAAAPSIAGAVTYNEAVSGDIDTFTAAVDALGQPTRNFIALDSGVNTFTGDINSPSDPVDVIPFSIADGQTLTGLSIVISNVLINSSTELVLDSLFTNTEPLNIPLQNFSTTLNFTDIDDFTLTIGGGVNVLSYVATLDVTSSGSGCTIDSPCNTGGVPEPASWALIIAGFGGVGAMLRRKTAARASV
jgi:PEP-CTERM motif